MADNTTTWLMLGGAAVAAYYLYENWGTLFPAAAPSSSTSTPPISAQPTQVQIAGPQVVPGTNGAVYDPANGVTTPAPLAGSLSIAAAFPLTMAALAAAGSSYPPDLTAQLKATMQTYVNMAANGDSFGGVPGNSSGVLASAGAGPNATVLGVYDQTFAHSIQVYLASQGVSGLGVFVNRIPVGLIHLGRFA
jgi:hypothetical protein